MELTLAPRHSCSMREGYITIISALCELLDLAVPGLTDGSSAPLVTLIEVDETECLLVHSASEPDSISVYVTFGEVDENTRAGDLRRLLEINLQMVGPGTGVLGLDATNRLYFRYQVGLSGLDAVTLFESLRAAAAQSAAWRNTSFGMNLPTPGPSGRIDNQLWA